MISVIHTDDGGVMMELTLSVSGVSQFASGIEAEIIGKPSKTFFLAALSDMGFSTDKVRILNETLN